MKKFAAVAISSLLALSANLAFADSIELLESPVGLGPGTHLPVSLSKLTPNAQYQVVCGVSNDNWSKTTKGAIDVYPIESSLGTISVNNTEAGSGSIFKYVLPSATNTLTIQSVVSGGASSQFDIKNQSTVTDQTLTVDSCTATPQ